MPNHNDYNTIITRKYGSSHSYEEPNGKFLKVFSYVALLSSLALFVFVSLSAFKYNAEKVDILNIKLVRKDLTPVRVPPENPGGAQFSNQDKLIYNSLDDSVAKGKALKKREEPTKLIASKQDEDIKALDKAVAELSKPAQPKTTPSEFQKKERNSVFDVLD